MPDATNVFERMLRSNETIERYSFSLATEGGLFYSTKGSHDHDKNITHSTISVCDDEVNRFVERYWQDEHAFGRPNHLDRWFKIAAFAGPQSLLRIFLSIVSIEDRKEFQDIDGQWILDVEPNIEQLKNDPEQLLGEIFNLDDLVEHRGENFVHKIIQSLESVAVSIRYILSPETSELNEVVMRLIINDRETLIRTKFWDFNSESIQIDLPDDVFHSEDQEVTLRFLFLRPSRCGWSEHNHMLITDRAIKLIADFDDGKGHYEEIYQHPTAPNYYGGNSPGSVAPKPCHPSVTGSWSEDAWDDNRTLSHHRYYEEYSIPALTYRAFNHFGYGDKGLEWEDYFYLISKDVKKPINGSFVSALHWGKIDGQYHEDTEFYVPHLKQICSYKNDPMNFHGAIKVYGDGDDQGRIEGYRRMGHVVHLLQDLAQPDHAQLKDHAGSTMDHPQANEKFGFCEADFGNSMDSAIAATAVAGLAVGIVIVIIGCAETDKCNETKKNIVGFEKLINDMWNEVEQGAPWKLPDHVNTLTNILSIEGNDYEALFKNMGQNATQAASTRFLPTPLGLDSLRVSLTAYLDMKLSDDEAKQEAVKQVHIHETIPGLIPNINKDSVSARTPYIELAREVIDKAIVRSAALLMYYLEIVNPPPTVQSFCAVKATANYVPTGYPKIEAKSTYSSCSNVFVGYHAEWQNKMSQRELQSISTFLSSSHSIIIFVEFGPTIWQSGKIPDFKRRMDSGSVKVTAVSPAGLFQPIEIPVMLGNDPDKGQYYWGQFTPPSLGSDYEILFHIEGKDDSCHLGGRGQDVRTLDSDPSTVARVDVTSDTFKFIDYEPGTDQNHVIQVTKSIMPDHEEPNDDFDSATEVILTNEKMSCSFKDLTLPNGKDKDIFLVKYESSEEDDQISSSSVSGLTAGFYARITAPRLSFRIREHFNGCMEMRIYNANRTVFREYTIIDNDPFQFDYIEAPTANLQEQKKELYIELRSVNFGSPDPLQYDLMVTYTPAEKRIEGKLLYEFWEYLGYPLPSHSVRKLFEVIGNPPDFIIYRDTNKFIAHINEFANRHHPDNLATVKERDIWAARLNAKIGLIAKNLNHTEKAIDIFKESSGILMDNDLRLEALLVKQHLKRTLISVGRIDEAKTISITRQL